MFRRRNVCCAHRPEGWLPHRLSDCCGDNMDMAAVKLLSLVVLIECWRASGQGQVNYPVVAKCAHHASTWYLIQINCRAERGLVDIFSIAKKVL